MSSFHTVSRQLRVQTHSSSSSSTSSIFFFFSSSFHRGCPWPGPLVFQIQAGAPSLRPAGTCSAARVRLNAEQRVRNTSVPFFRVRSSFLQDLLLWFTSLFLFWGRISASVSKHRRKEKKNNVSIKTSCLSRSEEIILFWWWVCYHGAQIPVTNVWNQILHPYSNKRKIFTFLMYIYVGKQRVSLLICQPPLS